jgi:hypothetical protein
MPENPHDPTELPREPESFDPPSTDRAPPWNFDAPTRSDRGSGRIVMTAETVEMPTDDASELEETTDGAPPAPPIFADLSIPRRVLYDLSDDFETADTK